LPEIKENTLDQKVQDFFISMSNYLYTYKIAYYNYSNDNLF